MDKYERLRLDKADSLMNWSFVGVGFPLVGWILAGISRSMVIALPEATNSGDQKVVNAIFRKFKISLVLSILMFIIYTCLGTIAAFYIQQQQIARQHAIEQAQQEQDAIEREAKSNAVTARAQQLQSCINDADNWFRNAGPTAGSVGQLQVLVQMKQQQVAECQARYSVN